VSAPALDVVELENRDVALTAVDARVACEMTDNDRAGGAGAPPLRHRDLAAMQVAARAEVCAKALAAPVLASRAHAVERLQRQAVPTPSTALHHEHMFA
jgi:hypothetical protein